MTPLTDDHLCAARPRPRGRAAPHRAAGPAHPVSSARATMRIPSCSRRRSAARHRPLAAARRGRTRTTSSRPSAIDADETPRPRPRRPRLGVPARRPRLLVRPPQPAPRPHPGPHRGRRHTRSTGSARPSGCSHREVNVAVRRHGGAHGSDARGLGPRQPVSRRADAAAAAAGLRPAHVPPRSRPPLADAEPATSAEPRHDAAARRPSLGHPRAGRHERRHEPSARSTQASWSPSTRKAFAPGMDSTRRCWRRERHDAVPHRDDRPPSGTSISPIPRADENRPIACRPRARASSRGADLVHRPRARSRGRGGRGTGRTASARAGPASSRDATRQAGQRDEPEPLLGHARGEVARRGAQHEAGDPVRVAPPHAAGRSGRPSSSRPAMTRSMPSTSASATTSSAQSSSRNGARRADAPAVAPMVEGQHPVARAERRRTR